MTNKNKTTKSLTPIKKQNLQEISKQNPDPIKGENWFNCSTNEKGEIDVVMKDIGINDLKEAFGVESSNLSTGLLQNMMIVASDSGGKFTDKDINFAFGFLKEIKPRDPLEAMLAIQMFGTHLASCKSFQRANLINQTQEMISESINRATKLTRTFVTQMDALKKHRGKGDQKITVEHINVNDGGKVTIGESNIQINNDLRELIDGGVGIK